MTEEERKQFERQVLDIIKTEFRKRFMVVYENTHRVTRQLPLPPANEIRNGLEHLSKALVTEDVRTAEANITNARAHLMFATMDCYLVCIDTWLDMMGDFERYGHLPPADDLWTDLAQLRSFRNRVFETVEPVAIEKDDVRMANLGALEKIYNDLLELQRQANELYRKCRIRFEVGELIKAHAEGIWDRKGRLDGHAEEDYREAEEKVWARPVAAITRLDSP